MLRCDADVVVIHECSADELLQLGLMEYRGPVLIAERICISAGLRCVIGAAKGRRSRHRRPLVVGPNGATGQKEEGDAAEEECRFQTAREILHASPPKGRADGEGPPSSPDSGRCG